MEVSLPRPRSAFVLLLVAVVALLAAAGTSAARDEETKLKLEFVPCLPVGEDDAGGELEWESDTQILKAELWGATDRVGETLDLFLDVAVDGERVHVFIGSVTIGEDGKATIGDIRTVISEPADYQGTNGGYYESTASGEPGRLVFSSNPDACSADRP